MRYTCPVRCWSSHGSDGQSCNRACAQSETRCQDGDRWPYGRPMRRGATSGNPALRLLVTGTALSALGDFVALFALTLRLHDDGGSGFAVSGLLLAGTVPLVV